MGRTWARRTGRLLLGVMGVAGAGSVLATGSAGASLHPPTPGLSTAAAVAVTPDLVADATDGTPARVLVRLRMPFTVEGSLSSWAVKAQRRTIAARTDAVAEVIGAAGRTTGVEMGRTYETIPWVAAKVDGAALDALVVSPAVARIVREQVAKPSLGSSLGVIGADVIHTAGLRGTGKVVAVIDTGVDRTHPTLKGRVTGEACFDDEDTCPNGESYQSGKGAAAPCGWNDCDHGTHVASIAASARPAGETVYRNGVAPGAHVLAYRTFHRSTDCDSGETDCARTHPSDYIKALESAYVSRHNFDLAAVNLSLGSNLFPGACDDEPATDIVNQLKSVGILTVAAAGNDSMRSSMSSPACITNVVSVANSTDTDLIAGSSNISSTTDLVAPGEDIQAAVPGNGWAIKSGTSMAAPHVAGAFALLAHEFPNDSPSARFRRLRDSGTPVTDRRGMQSGITKPRIDVRAAFDLPTVSFSSSLFAASNEDNPDFKIRVKRKGNLNWASTVDIRSLPGTATTDVDFGKVFWRLSFAPGQAHVDVPVPILEDNVIEPQEQFQLELYRPSKAITSSSLLPVYINEDDTEFNMSSTAQTINEKGRSVKVRVQRKGRINQPATVMWETVDGSAREGVDFTGRTGTVEFPANATERSITIPIVDDSVPGLSERTFEVRLLEADPGYLGNKRTTVVRVQEDEVGFSLEKMNATVAETAGSIKFKVTRTGSWSTQASVDYGIQLLANGGNATPGEDFTATSGTLTFPVNVGSLNVTVPVLDDTAAEGDESFSLVLSSPSAGAQLRYPDSTFVRILDDETGVRVSVSERVGEADGAMSVFVHRFGNLERTSSVDFITQPGTANAGEDYTPASGRLTFAAGQFRLEFSIPIISDSSAEGDETVNVRLRNPLGAQVTAATASFVIVEDDAGVRFDLPAIAADEGQPVEVGLQRVGPGDEPVAVRLSTADGTATAGADYAAASTRVEFAPGERRKTVTIGGIDDGTAEGDEIYSVRLSEPEGPIAIGSVPSTAVTVVENEAGAQFTAAEYSVGEGQGRRWVDVHRFGPGTGRLVVTLATADGSARAGRDYEAVKQSLVFEGLTRSLRVGIPILDDTDGEANEAFSVVLGDRSGGRTIGNNGTATITIVETDAVISMGRPEASIVEGAGVAELTVRRSGNPSTSVAVTVRAVGRSAGIPGDVAEFEQVVTFGPRQAEKTVSVPIVDDGEVEGTESFLVELAPEARGVDFGPVTATAVEIVDNDTSYVFGPSIAVTEGGDATVTVERIGVPRAGNLAWVAEGTAHAATPGDDFTPTRGTVTFTEESSVASIVVSTVDDRSAERPESFAVRMVEVPAGWHLNPDETTGAGVVRIDDDEIGVEAGPDIRVNEADGVATVTIERTGPTPAGRVEWYTADGSAESGRDFIAARGFVDFAEGETTKTVTIDLVDDREAEDAESFTVEIGGVPRGWWITRARATVLISANDQMGR